MKLTTFSLTAFLLCAGILQAQAPVPPDVSQWKILQPWAGDLDGMVKRRMIRPRERS